MVFLKSIEYNQIGNIVCLSSVLCFSTMYRIFHETFP